MRHSVPGSVHGNNRNSRRVQSVQGVQSRLKTKSAYAEVIEGPERTERPEQRRAADVQLPPSKSTNGRDFEIKRALLIEAFASALIEDFLAVPGDSPAGTTTRQPFGRDGLGRR